MGRGRKGVGIKNYKGEKENLRGCKYFSIVTVVIVS